MGVHPNLGSARAWARGCSLISLAVALGATCAAPAMAQAPGAGLPATPPTQPSAAIPPQPEGTPGYQTHGFSGSGPNVTGPAGGAQTNGEATVQEVVVTARRTAENLQNVPLSVTALGAKQLDTLQVRQYTDLSSLVPGLSIQQTATPGGSVTFIRGIPGQGLPNIDLDSRVGIYLDGVYIARTEGQSFALADIQQVEVLKGPQGTLFGKNTTGGSINFITQGPTGKLGGDVEAGFGDYSRLRFKATINLPEYYGFSTRFSYAYDARDGDVDNLAAGRRFGGFYEPSTNTNFPSQPTASTLGGYENQSIFAAVRYKGVPHLTVDYKFDYSQDYKSAPQNQPIGFPGTPVGCVGASFYLGGAINCGGSFTSLGLPVIDASASHPGVAVNKLSERYDPFESTDLVRTFGSNLTMQYEFSPDFTIKSITGYRQLQVQGQENTAGGDFEAVNSTFNFFSTFIGGKAATLPATGDSFYCASCSIKRDWQSQFSEEVQGIGKFGHVIDYVAGLYYFKEAGGSVNAFEANAAPIANYGVSPLLAPPNGVAPQGLPPLTSATTVIPASAFLDGDAEEITSQSAAAYLHMTGHIGEKIDLSAGVRYTDDYKSQAVSSATYTTIVDPSTGALVVPFRSVNFSRITYDGTATYRFTPDINAYVRYATAYLAGGLFRNIEFKPEDTKGEEVGVKSQLFGHKLQIDGALFHQETTNYQTDVITDTGAIVVYNTGGLITQGAELSGTYVPFRGLTLNANAAYAGQKYSDHREIQSPRLTMAYSAQYDMPRFANDMYLSFEADTNYQSKFHPGLTSYAVSSGTLPAAAYEAFGFSSQQAYLNNLEQVSYDGGFWLTNARVSLLDIPVDGLKGRLSVFATNLFDERGPIYTTNYGLFVGANYEPDRTFGVDLAVAF